MLKRKRKKKIGFPILKYHQSLPKITSKRTNFGKYKLCKINVAAL